MLGECNPFNLNEYLNRRSKANNERASIVEEFVKEINEERKGTKWKQVTGTQIAVKLGHIKDESDLYFFLKKCREYKVKSGSFSKCFFGALKVDK